MAPARRTSARQRQRLVLTGWSSGSRSASRPGRGCWRPARTRASPSAPSRCPETETGSVNEDPEHWAPASWGGSVSDLCLWEAHSGRKRKGPQGNAPASASEITSPPSPPSPEPPSPAECWPLGRRPTAHGLMCPPWRPWAVGVITPTRGTRQQRRRSKHSAEPRTRLPALPSHAAPRGKAARSGPLQSHEGRTALVPLQRQKLPGSATPLPLGSGKPWERARPKPAASPEGRKRVSKAWGASLCWAQDHGSLLLGRGPEPCLLFAVCPQTPRQKASPRLPSGRPAGPDSGLLAQWPRASPPRTSPRRASFSRAPDQPVSCSPETPGCPAAQAESPGGWGGEAQGSPLSQVLVKPPGSHACPAPSCLPDSRGYPVTAPCGVAGGWKHHTLILSQFRGRTPDVGCGRSQRSPPPPLPASATPRVPGPVRLPLLRVT